MLNQSYLIGYSEFIFEITGVDEGDLISVNRNVQWNILRVSTRLSPDFVYPLLVIHMGVRLLFDRDLSERHN